MFTVALILLLTAAGYFIITTLVDLAPYNNVRGSTRSERSASARPVRFAPAPRRRSRPCLI